MARARKDIVIENSLHHVTWRCHNRSFYLNTNDIKAKIHKVLVLHKKRYKVRIFDYVFMSNHVHLLVYVDDLRIFSDFMRACNSAIARIINKAQNKTSQAIADRYRSPVIQDEFYLVNTISYVWMNPFRANMIELRNLEDYRFSSLYARSRGLEDALLDDYSELKELVGYDPSGGENQQKFVRDYLNALKSRFHEIDFSSLVFEHLHSVGDDGFRKARRNRCASGSSDPP